MKREYIINCLNRIEHIKLKTAQLKILGVDLTDIYSDLELLEDSIAVILARNEKAHEEIIELTQWWLYDKSEKVISESDSSGRIIINVKTAESFTDYLMSTYLTIKPFKLNENK